MTPRTIVAAITAAIFSSYQGTVDPRPLCWSVLSVFQIRYRIFKIFRYPVFCCVNVSPEEGV